VEEVELTWDKVKLYDSNKIDRLEVIGRSIDNGEMYSGVNATLGGQLEKYWYYSYGNGEKTLNLAKKTPVINNIITIREIIASKIYEKQGYRNFCKYRYILNRHGQVVGCKCRAFTSEDLEIITAFDLLEEYGKTQCDDIYENIVDFASRYGANKKEIIIQIDLQTLVDYLITNRDRHQNNIAFLRNPNTLKIVGISPIYDSGSSVAMEGEKPLGVTNTTVHNLYNTELDCLKHVVNINTIDIDKLPDIKWIKEQLFKMYNANDIVVDSYLSLYIRKIEYLKSLQNK